MIRQNRPRAGDPGKVIVLGGRSCSTRLAIEDEFVRQKSSRVGDLAMVGYRPRIWSRIARGTRCTPSSRRRFSKRRTPGGSWRRRPTASRCRWGCP